MLGMVGQRHPDERRVADEALRLGVVHRGHEVGPARQQTRHPKDLANSGVPDSEARLGNRTDAQSLTRTGHFGEHGRHRDVAARFLVETDRCRVGGPLHRDVRGFGHVRHDLVGRRGEGLDKFYQGARRGLVELRVPCFALAVCSRLSETRCFGHLAECRVGGPSVRPHVVFAHGRARIPLLAMPPDAAGVSPALRTAHTKRHELRQEFARRLAERRSLLVRMLHDPNAGKETEGTHGPPPLSQQGGKHAALARGRRRGEAVVLLQPRKAPFARDGLLDGTLVASFQVPKLLLQSVPLAWLGGDQFFGQRQQGIAIEVFDLEQPFFERGTVGGARLKVALVAERKGDGVDPFVSHCAGSEDVLELGNEVQHCVAGLSHDHFGPTGLWRERVPHQPDTVSAFDAQAVAVFREEPLRNEQQHVPAVLCPVGEGVLHHGLSPPRRFFWTRRPLDERDGQDTHEAWLVEPRLAGLRRGCSRFPRGVDVLFVAVPSEPGFGRQVRMVPQNALFGIRAARAGRPAWVRPERGPPQRRGELIEFRLVGELPRPFVRRIAWQRLKLLPQHSGRLLLSSRGHGHCCAVALVILRACC